MKLQDALDLLKEAAEATLQKHAVGEYLSGGGGTAHEYDRAELEKWLALAGTGLTAVFPAGHFVRKQWEGVVPLDGGELHEHNVDRARAIVVAARDLASTGKLGSVLDGVRGETVSEVLDQADQLHAAGHLVAACVLAGGALETHLLHLCTRNGLSWPGAGSIEKYNNAIGQARNNGNEIYSANDTKQVTSWGGTRNSAAHDPTHFSITSADAGLMKDGIRNFISRVP